jgi:hypothetical protein
MSASIYEPELRMKNAFRKRLKPLSKKDLIFLCKVLGYGSCPRLNIKECSIEELREFVVERLYRHGEQQPFYMHKLRVYQVLRQHRKSVTLIENSSFSDECKQKLIFMMSFCAQFFNNDCKRDPPLSGTEEQARESSEWKRYDSEEIQSLSLEELRIFLLYADRKFSKEKVEQMSREEIMEVFHKRRMSFQYQLMLFYVDMTKKLQEHAHYLELVQKNPDFSDQNKKDISFVLIYYRSYLQSHFTDEKRIII